MSNSPEGPRGPVRSDDWERPPSAELSVILGCYNGATYVEGTILGLVERLDEIGRSYELLVVEDGSQDASLRILRNLEERIPQVTVLQNPKNMGKGFSIRNGVLNCRGRHIVFTDVDMAYSWANLVSVIEALLAGHPVVVGNRRLPESMYTASNRLIRYVYRRHRIGLAFNLLVRTLFRLDSQDTQSGLKGFTRSVAMPVFRGLQTDGFLFDVEIFIRCRRLGIPVHEVPVHLTYDSDDSTVRQVREFLRILPDLIRIKLIDLRGGYGSDAPSLGGLPGVGTAPTRLAEAVEPLPQAAQVGKK